MTIAQMRHRQLMRALFKGKAEGVAIYGAGDCLAKLTGPPDSVAVTVARAEGTLGKPLQLSELEPTAFHVSL